MIFTSVSRVELLGLAYLWYWGPLSTRDTYVARESLFAAPHYFFTTRSMTWLTINNVSMIKLVQPLPPQSEFLPTNWKTADTMRWAVFLSMAFLYFLLVVYCHDLFFLNWTEPFWFFYFARSSSHPHPMIYSALTTRRSTYPTWILIKGDHMPVAIKWVFLGNEITESLISSRRGWHCRGIDVDTVGCTAANWLFICTYNNKSLWYLYIWEYEHAYSRGPFQVDIDGDELCALFLFLPYPACWSNDFADKSPKPSMGPTNSSSWFQKFAFG